MFYVSVVGSLMNSHALKYAKNMQLLCFLSHLPYKSQPYGVWRKRLALQNQVTYLGLSQNPLVSQRTSTWVSVGSGIITM